ncbi:hypothetical protein BpHYR1_035519 [Brachionus plicatilis]|uniref:Uncharacterized protein n=1 Tax=Brachionus plicatilis TaxID=10195 RepID=A0A3M7SDC6_BRAPC|nr:hypothetical protein BpHYR1_035519 [Brachionus plicatilis]
MQLAFFTRIKETCSAKSNRSFISWLINEISFFNDATSFLSDSISFFTEAISDFKEFTSFLTIPSEGSIEINSIYKYSVSESSIILNLII